MAKTYLRVCQHIIVDAEARLPSSAKLQAGEKYEVKTAHGAAVHSLSLHRGHEGGVDGDLEGL